MGQEVPWGGAHCGFPLRQPEQLFAGRQVAKQGGFGPGTTPAAWSRPDTVYQIQTEARVVRVDGLGECRGAQEGQLRKARSNTEQWGAKRTRWLAAVLFAVETGSTPSVCSGRHWSDPHNPGAAPWRAREFARTLRPLLLRALGDVNASTHRSPPHKHKLS